MIVKPEVDRVYRLINKNIDEDLVVKIIKVAEKWYDDVMDRYHIQSFTFEILKVIELRIPSKYNGMRSLANEVDDILIILTEEEKDKLMVDLL